VQWFAVACIGVTVSKRQNRTSWSHMPYQEAMLVHIAQTNGLC